MKPRQSGFTLVETVLALGLVAFALVSLTGLLLLSLKTNRESMEQVKAANLAATMLSQRRAAPVDPSTTPTGTIAPFWLPQVMRPEPPPGGQPVTQISGQLAFTQEGSPATIPGDAFYLVRYRYQFLPASGRATGAHVHLRIEWPARAPDNSRDAYELVSLLYLP